MKTAAIGVGAIAGTLSGFMAREGNDVLMIDPWKEHVDAMNEKNREIAESINTLNQKTSVLQEKLEETTEEGEEIDDNLQGKSGGIDEKIVVNSGQTDQREFENIASGTSKIIKKSQVPP